MAARPTWGPIVAPSAFHLMANGHPTMFFFGFCQWIRVFISSIVGEMLKVREHLDSFVFASLISTWLIARDEAPICVLRKMNFSGAPLTKTNSR